MRGVVFDLDETLIDRTETLRVYARNLWEVNRDQSDLSQAEFIDAFLEFDETGYRPREEFYADAASLIAIPVLQFIEHNQAEIPNHPILFDGAISTLRTLKERDIPIGIVTNGSTRSQTAKIQSTGLDELVDHVVISEAFGEKKPAPGIFTEVSQQLSIDPSRSWFIGDHPVLDIWGSSQLGFRTIWIKRYIDWPEGHIPCHTHQVEHLDEVMGLIRGMLDGT